MEPTDEMVRAADLLELLAKAASRDNAVNQSEIENIASQGASALRAALAVMPSEWDAAIEAAATKLDGIAMAEKTLAQFADQHKDHADAQKHMDISRQFREAAAAIRQLRRPA